MKKFLGAVGGFFKRTANIWVAKKPFSESADRETELIRAKP